MANRKKANPNASGRHSRKRKLGVGKPMDVPATWFNNPEVHDMWRIKAP